MKSRNINKSSAKTRAIIKKTFAEMLSEKQEINKITVTELVKRADINRGTFYSHYDDIYCVAEDYENELIDKFFDDTRLISLKNADSFVDSFFERKICEKPERVSFYYVGVDCARQSIFKNP